jgi:hypothetical protein
LFGRLRDERPRQIAGIFIRNVTDAQADDLRFTGMVVFRHWRELASRLPGRQSGKGRHRP